MVSSSWRTYWLFLSYVLNPSVLPTLRRWLCSNSPPCSCLLCPQGPGLAPTCAGPASRDLLWSQREVQTEKAESSEISPSAEYSFLQMLEFLIFGFWSLIFKFAERNVIDIFWIMKSFPEPLSSLFYNHIWCSLCSRFRHTWWEVFGSCYFWIKLTYWRLTYRPKSRQITNM